MVSSVKVISSKEHGERKEVNPYVPSKLVDYKRQFGLKIRDEMDWLNLGQRFKSVQKQTHECSEKSALKLRVWEKSSQILLLFQHEVNPLIKPYKFICINHNLCNTFFYWPESLAKQVHIQTCSLAVWMSILISVNCRAVNQLPNLTPSLRLNIKFLLQFWPYHSS